MKMKIMPLLLIAALGFSGLSRAQENVKADGGSNTLNQAKARSISDVVWFGVDFTVSKFTLVADNPDVIVNQYLRAINTLILLEPEKYNIRNFFKKEKVTNSVDLVNEYNSKIDPSSLVITGEHKIDQDAVKNVIAYYTNPENSGTGLLFIAENLNKVSQTGSYYVCFFDIATKEIIDLRRMIGKAAGFGFRNYWAGSVFNTMKMWSEQ